MSNNVEKFLIEFNFADKKAIKQLKSFLGKVEGYGKQINKNLSDSIMKTDRKAYQQKMQLDDAHVKQRIKHEHMVAKASLAAHKFSLRNNYRFLQGRGEDVGSIRDRFERAAIRGDAKEMATLRAQVDETASAMRRHTRSVIGANVAQAGLQDSTRHLIRSYASLFALIEGTTAINRVGQDFEVMRASVLATSKDTEEAARSLAFVTEESKRLGLNLNEATKAYVKVKAAARDMFTETQQEEIFLGIAEASTVLGLSADDMAGSLRAVQQIIAKGKFTAEDFRLQLAERLPFAYEALRKATGKTSAELEVMFQRGEIMAEETMPKFAQALRDIAATGLEEKLRSVRTAQNRFVTSSQIAADTIFRGGFGEGLSQLFQDMTDNINESEQGLKGLGQVYKLFFDIIRSFTNAAVPILESLFFVLGEVSQTIQFMFRDNAGRIVAGITAITIAFTRWSAVSAGLNLILNSIYAKLLLVVAAADEFISLLDDKRMSAIEKYFLGGQQVGAMASQGVGMVPGVLLFNQARKMFEGMRDSKQEVVVNIDGVKQQTEKVVDSKLGQTWYNATFTGG